MILEGVHVWGHHGDLPEHDAQPERNDEREEVSTASSDKTVVDNKDERFGDVLVNESCRPF